MGAALGEAEGSLPNHASGRRMIRLLLRLPPKYLRTGLGWANDQIQAVDPRDDPSRRAVALRADVGGKRLDDRPGAARLVLRRRRRARSRHKQHGELIEVEDVEQALAKLGYELKPLDIVLIQTGGDSLLGKPEYFTQGPGMSAAATRWLLDHGVKVTGIDAWGWDGPLRPQAQRAKESGRNDVFWSAHYVGVDKEFCHLERLTNLDALPPTGFKVSASRSRSRAARPGRRARSRLPWTD